MDYETLKQENDQLKTQLGLEEEEPENELRAASVIGRDPNDVFYGFSIDQGTLSGVTQGAPVITDKGLVGWSPRPTPPPARWPASSRRT